MFQTHSTSLMGNIEAERIQVDGDGFAAPKKHLPEFLLRHRLHAEP
jgi:hypothetical protein